MLKSYFITAVKSIRRNVSYTALNVLGLTLGIAACLIIFLVVRNELSYDAFNPFISVDLFAVRRLIY